MSEEEIETFNDCMVVCHPATDTISVMLPRPNMPKEQALRMAAWIVSITGDEERFQKILRAIQNT